ncbi:hypothetical protein [Streptomyces albidoflavus]|uniref:hypothetical protein n=1 Tax=Streptomyces albidoflavus TaxID=1886 RepID=UPI00344DDF50
MPTEIENTPKTYLKKIPCLRMSVDEFVTFMKGKGIEENSIIAYADNVTFNGLDDIKSAPSRFSGEPEVILSKIQDDGQIAYATISFKKKNTTIFEGNQRKFDVPKKINRSFANGLYEELYPFNNQVESVIGKITSISIAITMLSSMLLIAGVGINMENILAISFYDIPIIRSLSLIYLAALLMSSILKMRMPIIYNPRKTWWERHGESTAVGIFTATISALVVWYITGCGS